MTESLDPLLHGILPPGEKSDMVLVSRINYILPHPHLVTQLLESMHFWYHPDMHHTKQVFWSENHAIMYMSCEVLLRGTSSPLSLLHRLRCLLSVKLTLGFAEFLSPVYLPFTIASLIHLYDACVFDDLRITASALLNRIASELLSVSLQGSSLMTPSGRAYLRHRLQTRGHHIHVFLDFLQGKPIIADNEQALKHCLSTTRYRPTIHPMPEHYQLSPTRDELYAIVHSISDPTMVITLLWSHGMYLPLQRTLARVCIECMDQLQLWKHPHFQKLSSYRERLRWMSPSCIATLLVTVATIPTIQPYLRGAFLTDAFITIYKKGNLIVTSLTNYHPGCPCYQQLPWAVNLHGIAIWCSFGTIGTGGLGELGNPEAGKELSTGRCFPYITHNGNTLIACYSSKTLLGRFLNRHYRPIMRFPTQELDEHGIYKEWTWGRKETSMIAFKIQHHTVHVKVEDDPSIHTTSFLKTL